MSHILDLDDMDWGSSGDEDNEIINNRLMGRDEYEELSKNPRIYGGGDDDNWNYFSTDDEDDQNQTSEAPGKNGEEVDMGIEDGASKTKSNEKRMSECDVKPMEEYKLAIGEEDMSTGMKKKSKRKSQEDGVESKQNDNIKTAIEVKKKTKPLNM
ncbi:hypothetical protein MKW92_005441 [Papaver armeniacum]|nr:hypothetical protein MKW92_005441 [Papaver armeniacum]